MTSLASIWRHDPKAAKTVAQRFGDVIHGLREGREMEHRYFVLSRLSDKELARRGIKREDLPRVAMTGRNVF